MNDAMFFLGPQARDRVAMHTEWTSKACQVCGLKVGDHPDSRPCPEGKRRARALK